jgi:hypothetical protein
MLLLLLLLLKRIIIQDKKHFSKRVAVINVCPVMFIKINYNCILYNINYNITDAKFIKHKLKDNAILTITR